MAKNSGLKALFAPVDMIEGSPAKKILAFAIPMLIGNVAQQLYNTVDSIVVGRYVGDNALAAVGSAGPILNLLLVLFVGISTGSTIMVSQYMGARSREDLNYSVGTSMTLMGIASVIIMIIGPLCTRPLLIMLHTPEAILDWCTSYLVIMFVGIIGMSLYNILGGILRGLGDSVSALVYLLVATVLNIILDIAFVAWFDMGVAGVALATVIAQAVSGVLCIFKLMKMTDILDIKWHYMIPKWSYSSEMIRLGIPSGVTQAIFSMSMVMVQSLTNSFGEMFIAANVMIMRVDGFAMMPNFSFGTAMTTYVGQNVGARSLERVRKGTKQGTLMAVATSGTITLLILIFGKYLMGVFTSTEELVELSMHNMRILALGYVLMGITQCLQGAMRGAGDTMTPMWIALCTSVVIRMPLAYLLSYLTRSELHPNGYGESLFVSLLIAWICGAVITTICYKKEKWKRISGL